MLTFEPTYRVLDASCDLGAYLNFLNQLDSEAPYMHYGAGERKMTVEGLRSRLKKQDKQGNAFVVIAQGLDWHPIGYFSVNGGNSNATKHSATVAVGVLAKYQGNGIAKQLLGQALAMSVSCGVFRWECTVVQNNLPAVTFYRSQGFSAVGLLKSRFFSFGDYLNEYVLERLF